MSVVLAEERKNGEGNSMNCKVSIVVPVYNVEKYIGELIESIQKQSYENLEIILVDDGSPDRSGEICDQYASKDDRIKVIHKKNGGVGAARNDGLALATGEWIVFCDSDDWLETDAIKQLVDEGDRTQADVVFGDVNLVYGDRVEKAVFYREPFVTSDRAVIDKLIEADFCKTYCFDPPEGGPAFGYGGPWNKIVRRRLLEENNIKFDVRVKGIFDDLLYTAYIFAASKKVSYIHAVIYNYRQIMTSITRTYKSNLLEINNSIFQSWREFLEKYDESDSFLKPYYANVVRRLTTLLGLYYFNKKNPMKLNDQLKELKHLIQTEPYVSAINADSVKLNNRFDRLVVKAARKKAVFQIYMFYIYTQIKRIIKGKR